MMNENTHTNHIKNKIIKLYLNDMNTPMIIITYKVNNNHAHKEFVRDKIYKWITDDGKKRTISYLPCIFIRNDIITSKDLTTLDIANQLHLSINSNVMGKVDNEVDMIRLLKRIHRNKKYRRMEYEDINSEDSVVKLKNPHTDFVIYDTRLFSELATQIQLDITRQYQYNKEKGE